MRRVGEWVGVAVVGIGVLAFVGGFAVGGLMFARDGVRLAWHSFSKPDPRVRCDRSPGAGCFRSTRGIVEAPTGAYPDSDIAVRYDDGRRVVDLDLQGRGTPALGTQVDLEFWKGKRVSVYDAVREHRYRTTAWPQGAISVVKGSLLILAGSLFFIPIGLLVIPPMVAWRRGSKQKAAV